MAKRSVNQRWFIATIRLSSGKVKDYDLKAGGRASARRKASTFAMQSCGVLLSCNRNLTKDQNRSCFMPKKESGNPWPRTLTLKYNLPMAVLKKS